MSQMFLFDDDHVCEADRLEHAKPEDQTEAMKEWFFAHYDDPVNVCPYESREGGYQYIWGGPYDVREALSDNFSGRVSDEVISQCADEIINEHSCYEWSGLPDWARSDDYCDTEFLETFEHSLEKVQSLLELNVNPTLEQHLLRLLLASVVTTLEAYLADAFIKTTLEEEAFRRKLVGVDPNLQKATLKLRDLVQGQMTADIKLREYLLAVSWHNLPRAKNLYQAVLGIVWPAKLAELYNAVEARHDIVHRNGKTREGKDRVLSREHISDVIQASRNLVNSIDGQLREVTKASECEEC